MDQIDKNKENKSRTYNSSMNMLLGFMNKFVLLILSFISRSIFIQVLSIDYLGINGLFTDILTMLSLADLGFGTAMAYSFYKPLANKEEEKLSALVNFYKKVYNMIALSVAVIGIALLPFLRIIVNTKNEIAYLEVYYLISLANTVISYLFIYKSSIISADQKDYIISRYLVWINLIKVLLQIIVLYATKNYIYYLMVSVCCTIGTNILVSYKANRMYPFIGEKRELSKEERKGIFSNLKSVFIYKISGVLLNGTDNMLISVLVGTAFVGLYSNYYALTFNQLGSMITIVFCSLTASIGNLIVKETKEKRFEIFKIMQFVSFWISGVCITCLYFLTNDFVVLWLGKECLMSKGVLICLLMNFYIFITFQPMWSFREATALYKKTKYVMLLTAGVNVVLSIILGKMYGVTGIIGATVIAKMTTYFLYEPYLLYKEYFSKDVVSYYLDHVKNIIIIVISIIVSQLVMPTFEQISIIHWLLKAVISFSIVNGIYLLGYCRTKEFRNIVNRLCNVIFKSEFYSKERKNEQKCVH